MRSKLIVTLGLALLAISSQAISAAPAAGRHIHTATGHWAGFAQSGVGNPHIASAPFSVEIASQTGPLVRGEITGLGGPDTKGALTGVVSPSGRAALLGLGDGGSIIDWSPAGLPPDPGMEPCVFEGRYMQLGRGLADRGRLVVVHQMPDPRAPSIGGAWRGVGNPDPRPVEAQFTQDANGLLTGRLSLGGVDPSDPSGPATFELAGHAAALERGGVGVEMVGGGTSDGMIIINGSGDPSGELSLSYRWIGAPGAPGGFEEGGIVIVGG